MPPDDEAADSSDEEERALLDALEQDLAALPAPTPAALPAAPVAAPVPVVFGAATRSIGQGLVHWPVEVKLGIASFLPFQDIISNALLCRVWRDLEKEDALWRTPFWTLWPRLARRKDARGRGGGGAGTSPPTAGPMWRLLFRTRWASKERTEDALEEDWLDFAAASELSAVTATRDGTGCAKLAPEMAARVALEAELCVALWSCRKKTWQDSGVHIPAEASPAHTCSASCKYHRLSIDGDAFVCEKSGRVHYCDAKEPCDDCVVSGDACFLTCRVSGRCWPSADALESEEVREEEAPANDWDPELSGTQQITRWFEQGYNMTEEQADEMCGPDDRKRRRRCYLLAH